MSHRHFCHYCDTLLGSCDATPDYACGMEGPFCSLEAEVGSEAFCCDDCAEIVWCEYCGEIEALPDEACCAACCEDGDE